MSFESLTRQRSPQTFGGIVAYLAARNVAVCVVVVLLLVLAS